MNIFFKVSLYLNVLLCLIEFFICLLYNEYSYLQPVLHLYACMYMGFDPEINLFVFVFIMGQMGNSLQKHDWNRFQNWGTQKYDLHDVTECSITCDTNCESPRLSCASRDHIYRFMFPLTYEPNMAAVLPQVGDLRVYKCFDFKMSLKSVCSIDVLFSKETVSTYLMLPFRFMPKHDKVFFMCSVFVTRCTMSMCYLQPITILYRFGDKRQMPDSVFSHCLQTISNLPYSSTPISLYRLP